MRACIFVLVAVLILLGGLRATAVAADSVVATAVNPVADVRELFPAEPGVNAERGFAVALDGDLLAVGAPLDDGSRPNAGAVYLFRWVVGSWEPEAKLYGDPPPAEAEEPARFGSAVALRDGVLVVGAIGEGAVYVFVEDDGQWTLEKRLTGPARHGPGAYGRAVAFDGDWLAVGAVHPHGRGVVYLYSGPQWALPTRLAPAQRPGERFGETVALADGLLVVGAPGDGDDTEPRAGAAYVFRLGGPAPREIAKLVALGGHAGDQLGAAVATDGTTVALGAPTADFDVGAVFVSTCTAGGCDPPQPVAAGTRPEDLFGFSVAVEDNLLVAGVRGSAAPGDPGRLRIFRGAGAAWTEEAVPLPGNVEGGDLAGFAVALDAGPLDPHRLPRQRAVAAAVLGDQGSAAAGAVWSFGFVPTVGWREEAEAVARDPLLEKAAEPVIRFGVSVAATEQYLVIGALREGGQQSAGAVYVYRRAGGGWRQEARLTSPAGEDARDAFGTAVAVDGRSLLVGAPAGGAAYLFVGRDGSWSVRRSFFYAGASGDPFASEGFGVAVAIEGSTLAIGAPLVGPGVVQVHERGTMGWSPPVTLAAEDASPGDGFGAALSLRHGILAIGAPGRMEEFVASSSAGAAAIDVGSGAVYVAQRLEQSKWTAPLRLATPPLLFSDRLGAAVTVGDGFLAAGAPGRRNGDGAVLLYAGGGSSWAFARQIELDDGEHKREFGSAVALHGALDRGDGRPRHDSLLVGGPGREDLPPSDLDNAYLYERKGADWKRVAAVDAIIKALRGDRFGSAVALTESFLVVTHPGPAGGDPETAFKLRRNVAAEATK